MVNNNSYYSSSHQNPADVARRSFEIANEQVIAAIKSHQQSSPSATPLETIERHVLSTVGVSLSHKLQMLFLTLGVPHDVRVYPKGYK